MCGEGIMKQTKKILNHLSCRILQVGFFLSIVGCAATTADHTTIAPLPENGSPRPYAELLARIRSQATVATECYYTNDWDALQMAAKGMAQTSSLLNNASDVPVAAKESLSKIAPDLALESNLLLQAAKNRDEKTVNTTLQKILQQIRQLRLIQ